MSNQMIEVEETARVSMQWPKALKEKVRARIYNTDDTMTDFIRAATEAFLGDSAGIADLRRDLREARWLAQLLADRLVMGDEEDRLQMLMGMDFPAWIDPNGWPQAYAERVGREEVDARFELDGNEDTESITAEVVLEPEEPVFTPPEPVFTPPEPVIDPVPPRDLESRDDLFAKVMRDTGQDLSQLGLVPASQIPHPEPVVQDDRCTNCNDVLVDGECWTCGL